MFTRLWRKYSSVVLSIFGSWLIEQRGRLVLTSIDYGKLTGVDRPAF